MISKHVTTGPLGLVLALAWCSASAGASPERSADSLTPSTAARVALRANPDLRAAYQAIEVARGRLVQAGLWPNPELVLGGSSDFVSTHEGEGSANAGLAQPLPIFGRLARARDMGRVDVALALAEARDFERALIGEVQGSVVTLLALGRAIAEQERVIGAARSLVDASAGRFRVAEVSEADVNLLEIELARFEQDLRLLALERTTESLRLNRLLNRSPDAAVLVAGDLDAPTFDSAARETLMDQALQRRPDLHALRLEQDRAGAEVRLARAETWEDWTLDAGYEYSRGVFVPPVGVKRDDLVAIGISIPLPLWNRNQGRIAAAQAEGRRAGFRVAGRERLVQQEVGTELRRADELAHVVSEYRDRIVPRAERNVRLLEQGYREGLVGIAALVQAEQQYADAAIRFARTLGELRRAEIDLETAAAASPLLEPRITTGGTP
ncbi:MAG: TolC family protein [Gemmatimonadetes bacterium]|nr:TolC family protein [Gemmatimonadota bacterium]